MRHSASNNALKKFLFFIAIVSFDKSQPLTRSMREKVPRKGAKKKSKAR
jgi:hypothetical protein